MSCHQIERCEDTSIGTFSTVQDCCLQETARFHTGGTDSELCIECIGIFLILNQPTMHYAYKPVILGRLSLINQPWCVKYLATYMNENIWPHKTCTV